MKQNESGRYLCGECQTMFEPTLIDVRLTEHADDSALTLAGEPVCCPFCGDQDVRRVDEGPDVVV